MNRRCILDVVIGQFEPLIVLLSLVFLQRGLARPMLD